MGHWPWVNTACLITLQQFLASVWPMFTCMWFAVSMVCGLQWVCAVGLCGPTTLFTTNGRRFICLRNAGESVDFSKISFVCLIAWFAWGGFIRLGGLPDLLEQDWSGCKGLPDLPEKDWSGWDGVPDLLEQDLSGFKGVPDLPDRSGPRFVRSLGIGAPIWTHWQV